MKNIFVLAGMIMLLPCSLSAAVSFNTPPQDQTVCSGSPATFSVGATGAANLIYQWQVSTNGGTVWNNVSDGSVYTGATTMTLRISAATTAFNNFRYRCNVSDGAMASSTAAILHVNAGLGPVPSLSGNIAQTQCANTTGSSPVNTQTGFNYQWQTSTDGLSWTDLDPADPDYSGAQDAVLTWFGTQTAGTAQLYRYKMTSSSTGCAAISAIDTLRLAPAPNSLVPSPTSTSVCPGGGNINFAFTAPPSGYAFRWQESADNGVTYNDLNNTGVYSGVGSTSLTLTGIVITSTMKYRARTSLTTFNLTCETFSIPATLTLKTLPVITAQPGNAFVCANTSPKLAVTATGATITYQWQVSTNGGASWADASTGTTGAATRQVTLNNVTLPMDGYKYRVLVKSPCVADLTSNPVTLRIGSDGTWLGAQDTAWEHVGNWCSIVPVQTTDVLVPSWAPRMPLISDGTGTAYSRSLTIQSGASLTISGGVTSFTGPFNIPGTVSYTGTVNQNILPADHGSLYISGSGNKTLQSNVAVSNTLGLGGSAKLITGSNILTMNAGSNPITGTGGNSWIVTGNGSSGAGNTGLGGLKMKQASAGSLLFPIGPTSAAYNPLTLTNSGAVNDFTIAVNDQIIPGGPSSGVVVRTWLVSAANTGSQISLGLQWAQIEEGSAFNRNNATIIRSNGTIIVEKSAAGAAGGADPYNMSGGNFSTFTQFSVGTNTMVPLSLPLANFSAKWINNISSGIYWTADQHTGDGVYTIQRSADGILFNNIGTVPAEKERTSYNYIDARPMMNNFYRILLTAPDGSAVYSRIVQLAGEGIDLAALAPSVVEGSATSLLLLLRTQGEVIYNVSDVSGHMVANHSARLAAGFQRVPLDVGRLRPGIYFVRITGAEGLNKTLTLIKK